MSGFAPVSVPDVVSLVEEARSAGQALWFSGSGTTAVPDGHTVISTERMVGVVDYRPDDLTIVVRAGMTLADLDQTLEAHGHTAVLPETAPNRTVGGVISAGVSGYRRLRYGPTRDRVIGVTFVSGYGEVVHAGGQLVKNVTGYDVPRLMTGSHGALGFVAEIYLKLWPEPETRSTIRVDDIAAAWQTLYQPTAALENERGGFAYVSGSQASVSAQVDSLEGSASEGFVWPDPVDEAVVVHINVPPRLVPDAVGRLRDVGAHRFVAQHGVGVVEVGWSEVEESVVAGLRAWAESSGGSLVIQRPGSLSESLSRWGRPPETVDIQRRLKELFDPDRVCNPGVLPGGV